MTRLFVAAVFAAVLAVAVAAKQTQQPRRAGTSTATAADERLATLKREAVADVDAAQVERPKARCEKGNSYF